VIENYRPGFLPDVETNVRTEYEYDDNGNLIVIRDANTHETHFTYDALNRLELKSDALGNEWEYFYDDAGQLSAITDAKGQTVQFTYDANGQLTLIDYPAPDADISFTYDSLGRRTDMQDGIGTTVWDYDALSRPGHITDPFDNVVGYEYDALGNQTALHYPDGKTVNYTYDLNNFLISVTDWNNDVTAYDYDGAGQLLTVSRPNNVDTAFNYDDAGRLLSITHQNDLQTLASYTYGYDNVGNRIQAIESVLQPELPEALNQTIDYTLDPLYRLTAANYSTGDYFHYTYDYVGNRLTQAKSVNGVQSSDMYVYNVANQLSSVNGVNFTWDANGNLTSDGVNTYTYDHADRLITVQNQTTAIENRYNGLGDRVQQIVNGGTTTFTLDINSPLTQVLADGTNTYLYGLDRIAQSSLTTEYFLPDALGSARQMVDAGSAVQSAASYEPFGAPLSDGASSYGFAGEWQDPTGLVYLRARFYSPELGIFLSHDPFPGFLTEPASLSPYKYAFNNPVRYTDPSGKNPLFLSGLLGSAISGFGFSEGTCPWETITTLLNNFNGPPPPWFTEENIVKFLYTLAWITQDIATGIDLGYSFAEVYILAYAIGGGPEAVLLTIIGMEIFFNYTGGNAAELAFSTISFVATFVADNIDDGGIGENTSTTLATLVTGAIIWDPMADLAVDSYASGFNHGLFNGIDTLMNGGTFINWGQ